MQYDFETLWPAAGAGAPWLHTTHTHTAEHPEFVNFGVAEMKFRPKPSGEGVRYLLDRYGLDPADTWYVGDRAVDMYCAKDAGVNALLYLEADSVVSPTGLEDRIVSSLREI